jgi:hypothetical protein
VVETTGSIRGDADRARTTRASATTSPLMTRLKVLVLLLGSHALVAAAGFAAGIYALPILIAPPPPTASQVTDAASKAAFVGHFRRDLKGSDALHWGEGTVSVGTEAVALMGRLSPGPDYRLYLAPDFVETEEAFERLKSSAVQVGHVRTFENFVVPMPAGTDPSRFTTVVVWCETFREFITSARYR